MAVQKSNIDRITPRKMPGRDIYDLVTKDVLGSTKIALEVTRVAPGQALRPCHAHKAEETAYVVSGKGLVWVDGSFDDLKAGDAILWPSGSKHCLKNTGEGELVLVCAFSTPSYQSDYAVFGDIEPFSDKDTGI